MMKLLDYFYSDYIADLALVENSEFQEQSIKFILKHDNLSEARVKELNDDRLINFSFSTNILMFLDQTISYYFSFGYENFIKKYDFANHLLGTRILDYRNWLQPRLSLIYKRIESKTIVNNIYNGTLIRENLIKNKFEKICLKKLEESASVIISELDKIAKIFNYHEFKQAYISALALDQDLRNYLNINTNEKKFSNIFFQSLWMELFKKDKIDKDKLYFLNYLLAKDIHAYRDGIPFSIDDICVDYSISENKEFKSKYEDFIERKNYERSHIY